MTVVIHRSNLVDRRQEFGRECPSGGLPERMLEGVHRRNHCIWETSGISDGAGQREKMRCLRTLASPVIAEKYMRTVVALLPKRLNSVDLRRKVIALAGAEMPREMTKRFEREMLLQP